MECCGNCGNCHYDPDTGEQICSCEASNAYGLDMAFNDGCEEWCSNSLIF